MPRRRRCSTSSAPALGWAESRSHSATSAFRHTLSLIRSTAPILGSSVQNWDVELVEELRRRAAALGFSALRGAWAEPFLAEREPADTFAVVVDTGRVVDRAVAARAGLGWYGKNALILTPAAGSWVMLGEIVTTLALPLDQPLRKSCGSCTRCLSECPTGA